MNLLIFNQRRRQHLGMWSLPGGRRGGLRAGVLPLALVLGAPSLTPAQEAGANMVMARSAFSQNLQQILKRHAGVL